MPAPTSGGRKKEATRDAILGATSQLIGEKGVDGFSISDVAKRGNINRALIYHYFQNRDNLVYEAIRYLVGNYEPPRPALSPQAAEAGARMNIEHPEMSRFFFQMLLSGRPLPGLSQRMFDAMGEMEKLKAEVAPKSRFDPAMSAVMATLVQLSWAFARHEIARHLGITLEEADDRFIRQIRWAGQALRNTLIADGKA